MIEVPYEVKELLMDGRTRKKYRFDVLNKDLYATDFTIDNDTLISESVSIDERMCSDDTIKFGLCEGSSLEFQYFDHPLITGRTLKGYIDIDYVHVEVTREYETLQEVHIMTMVPIMEDGLYYVYSDTPVNFDYVWVDHGGQLTKHTAIVADGKTYCEFEALTGDEIEVEFHGWGYDPTYLQIIRENREEQDLTCNIPMGYFTVEKCSRQASTGIIKVTAYNKLEAKYLDEKGNTILDNLFYDTNFAISIFDIKRVMLDTYLLKTTRIELASTSSAVTTHYYTLSSLRLSQDYGVDSPVNGYTVTQAGQDPSLLLDVEITSKKAEWYWPTPWFLGEVIALDSAYGFLLDLEQRFINYLRDLIDGMKVSNYTTDNYIDAICYNVGFQYIFGVIEAPNFSTTPGQYKYSTVQKRYNIRQGTANSVNGSLADAMKEDFSTQSVAYKRYACYIPYSIKIGGVEIYFDGFWKSTSATEKSSTYSYWEDSGHTTLKEGTVKELRYSDGTLYEPDEKFPMNMYIFADLPAIEKTRRWTAPQFIPDFTIRDIVSGLYELNCQFGKLDRETDLFSGVELNSSRLLPAENLYPANDLYPGGAALSSHKSMYSKLWGDEGNVFKWRKLIIVYTTQVSGTTSGTYVDKDITYEATINEDGNVDYYMNNNWLLKNIKNFTSQNIKDFADAMVAKMQDVTWFPFEMWCAGLPYLEAGDEIEVEINGHTYPTYIMQRQLKGIHNLQDTYINGTLDIF